MNIGEIAEPQPSEEALRRYPEELGPVVGVPTIIVYRLRRTAIVGHRSAPSASGAGPG